MKCNEEQIIKTIKSYIEMKNCNYAILIDGQWGTGKTFFVKNTLMPIINKNNEKDKKAIYISTYGTKSTKEIDKKIYFEILNSKTPKNKSIDFVKKGGKIVLSGAKIVKDVFKLPNVSEDNINTFINLFQKIDRYILIFDDLERCQIPINELLGYINDFTEHKNVKVIIIAHEGEIVRNSILNNLETKYLVAINKNIEYKEDEGTTKGFVQHFNRRNGTDIANKKIDKEDIEKRVEYLFGEDKKYKQIKEKLIGNTIYYIPNMERVSNNLINEYIKDKKILGELIKEQNYITNVMQEYNHLNIRTLKIALEKFNQILNCLDNAIEKNEKYYNTLIVIFKYILYRMIKYKKGEKLEVWANNSETSELIDDFYRNIHAFKFVDDLILYSILDEEKINNVVLQCIKRVEIPIDENDALNKLKYYWEIQDTEVLKNIDELKNNLFNNKYKIEIYPEIVMKLVQVQEVGFSQIKIEEYIEIMEKNISKSDKEIDLDDFHVIASNEEQAQKYNNYMKRLKELSEDTKNKKNKDYINSLVENKEGWGKEFYEYCYSKKDNFLIGRTFFSLIEVTNLLNNINTSLPVDISYFRRTVCSIYNFDNLKEFYIEDIENLIAFAKGIEKQILNDTDSIVVKYNKKLLLDQINKIIDRLV